MYVTKHEVDRELVFCEWFETMQISVVSLGRCSAFLSTVTPESIRQTSKEGILRVADFLNYRVDPILMDNCGAILANKLSKRKVTKVLAGCSSSSVSISAIFLRSKEVIEYLRIHPETELAKAA